MPCRGVDLGCLCDLAKIPSILKASLLLNARHRYGEADTIVLHHNSSLHPKRVAHVFDVVGAEGVPSLNIQV